MQGRVSHLVFAAPIIGILLVSLFGCTKNNSSKNGETSSGANLPAAETAHSSRPTASKLDHKITSIQLPGAIDDFCLGAGGKLLIVRLKNLAKLVVIQADKAQIAGYISLNAPQDSFAAGSEKLVVIDSQRHLAKRYSLGDLTEEMQKPFSSNLPVAGIGMGAGSAGPLLVVSHNGVNMATYSLDLATLEMSDPINTYPVGQMDLSNCQYHVQLTSDGSSFCIWTELRNRASAIIRLASSLSKPCPQLMNIEAAYACLNDTGSQIFSGAGFLNVNNRCVDLCPELEHDGAMAIPAIGGPYYLSVPCNKFKSGPNPRNPGRLPPSAPTPPSQGDRQVKVYFATESAPFSTIPLEDFSTLKNLDADPQIKVPLSQRLLFLSAAKTIVELGGSSDCVVFHEIDVYKELQQVCPDVPVVISQPPKTAKIDELYRYPIKVLTKSGKAKFHLDSGPKGMTLSEQGVLEWTPKNQPNSIAEGVVISVEDSGKSKFHTFSLEVEPPSDIVASAENGLSDELWAKVKQQGNVRVKLPATFEDVCAGGNGRYLVFAFRSLDKLAVFDVPAGKIIGYLPLSKKALFAAGLEKLVIVSPEQSTIERYDLQSQKLEDKQTCEFQGTVRLVAMGAASQGPVLIVSQNEQIQAQFQLMDLSSLMPLACRMPSSNSRAIPMTMYCRAYTSSDGRVFAICADNTITTFTFTGEEFLQFAGQGGVGWAVPDETGANFYTMNSIYHNSPGKASLLKQAANATPENPHRECFLPAIHGPFFLQLLTDAAAPNRQQAFNVMVNVCVPGEKGPLASLHNLPVPSLPLIWQPQTPEIITIEKRIYFIPNAKLVVLLPEKQESVILHRFDLEESLRASENNYLAITSNPAPLIANDQDFQYQIVTASNHGNLRYHLDSGPEGMTVSDTGLVQWKVQNLPEDGEIKVRITVSDDREHNVQHNFELITSEKAEQLAALFNGPQNTPQQTRQRAANVPNSSAMAQTNGKAFGPWELTKVDEHRLGISDGDTLITPGLRHNSMLLLQGNHLAVLAADGVTIVGMHKLETRYLCISEREEYYVALSQQPPAIDLLNKNKLEIIRRIPLERGEPLGLVLHPTRPISYVVINRPHEDIRGVFWVVDEESDDIHLSKKYLGSWLAVDVAGQRLVAMASLSQVVGASLMLMPRPGAMGPPVVPQPMPGNPYPRNPMPRQPMPGPIVPRNPVPMPRGPSRSVDVRVVPQVGLFNALLVYDLDDNGLPHPSHISWYGSGNGKGFRMALDGLRASIYRKGSTNEVLDLDSVDEKPIQCAAGSAPIEDIAYHPVLPWVACLGASGPMLFDRETGNQRTEGLPTSIADYPKAKFHHLWFTADGKGLLLDVHTAENKRFLYRIDLQLSPEDAEKVHRRLANMTSLGRDLLSEHDVMPGNGNIPLSAMDAFKGCRGKEMTAQEISRMLTDTVVIVQCGQHFGTGVVVGRAGYILTCAHCIIKNDTISISYRSKHDNDVEIKKTTAKVLHIDRRRDLALLQIEDHSELPAVQLAMAEKVESGEKTIIIGNPGSGETILDYTITEGIVSNARRRLGHQDFIQTSAAVNPGSSGAPLFNSKGAMIGLVVLKANIENVGFAIPAAELATFLAMAVKATGPDAAIERQWFTPDDAQPITAQYLGVRDEAVQLRLSDGKETAIPLNKLSPQDAAFVRLFQPTAQK
jgi:S1-C subfamily serine protease